MSSAKAKTKKPSTPPIANVSASAAASTDPYALLNISQLSSTLASLQNDLQALRSSRNYHSQETNLLTSRLSTLNEGNEASRAHLHNVRAQISRQNESHHHDIKVSLQKALHLEFQQEQLMLSSATAHQQEEKSQLEACNQKTEAYAQERRDLAGEIEKLSLERQEECHKQRESYKRELQKLHENFEAQYKACEAAAEAKFKEMESSSHLRGKMECHEISERKNSHIASLRAHHERNFNEMKNYYNSITSDNVALIRELHTEIAEMKKNGEKKEKCMTSLQLKNANMTVPLVEIDKQLALLQHVLTNYEKDKNSLMIVRANVRQQRLKMTQLKLEIEACERELDALQQTSASSGQHHQQDLNLMQQLSSESGAITKSELARLKARFSQKEMEFSAILTASQLGAPLVDALTHKLDALLTAKNALIEGLTYERIKAAKAFDDTVRVVQAKLQQLGAPPTRVDPALAEVQPGKHTAPAFLI